MPSVVIGNKLELCQAWIFADQEELGLTAATRGDKARQAAAFSFLPVPGGLGPGGSVCEKEGSS